MVIFFEAVRYSIIVCVVLLLCDLGFFVFFFFFKQKTAYEMRISDWSSDVCSRSWTFGGDANGRATRLNYGGRYAEPDGTIIDRNDSRYEIMGGLDATMNERTTVRLEMEGLWIDRKSTRLNSSH